VTAAPSPEVAIKPARLLEGISTAGGGGGSDVIVGGISVSTALDTVEIWTLSDVGGENVAVGVGVVRIPAGKLHPKPTSRRHIKTKKNRRRVIAALLVNTNFTNQQDDFITLAKPLDQVRLIR
jgi:hypothetical protein